MNMGDKRAYGHWKMHVTHIRQTQTKIRHIWVMGVWSPPFTGQWFQLHWSQYYNTVAVVLQKDHSIIATLKGQGIRFYFTVSFVL